MIQTYEEEKQRMILDHQRELKTKMAQATAKLERVINDNKFNQNRIIEGYERRIKDLKRQYELDKIRNYGADKA